MIINKSYPATISHQFSLEVIFKALNKKYFITKFNCFFQVFRNWVTIITQKNGAIVKQHVEMLNLNAKIPIKMPKHAFSDKYFINFFITSILSIYGNIIDNLNIRKILKLEETIQVFIIKENKLHCLESMKERNANFAT